ncbi:response regulator [Nitriliruptoraceae bacterium ZYF776]|nr:response regulator [Profundirhabdus halotolerans]
MTPAVREVLVVDDDPLIRDVLRTILDLEEFEVRLAEDGEHALAAVDERVPQVVVCDVKMPGIDGYEVCRRLKAAPETAAVPVILLTARDRAEDRAAGVAAGCDAYVTKPFSPLHLIEVIGQVGAGAASRSTVGES